MLTICVTFQIERIKRANSLWTNDSLFLREYLLIPVPCNNSEQQCLPGPLISHEQFPQHSSGFFKVPMSPTRHRAKLQRSQTDDASTTVSLTTTAEDDLNTVDIREYFSKYDVLLAKLKNDTSKLESNSG